MVGGLSNITIRPYKILDVDDFIAYAGDDKVTRFTRWNTFKSKDEALFYIQESCIPHTFCRSICLDDRSIGYLLMQPRSANDCCRADIGYPLAAKYWGQGITTKALNMAIVDAFKEFLTLLRLQAIVKVENKASPRVLEKLGFLKKAHLRKYSFNKGEVRDMVMFSLVLYIVLETGKKIVTCRNISPAKYHDIIMFEILMEYKNISARLSPKEG